MFAAGRVAGGRLLLADRVLWGGVTFAGSAVAPAAPGNTLNCQPGKVVCAALL